MKTISAAKIALPEKCDLAGEYAFRLEAHLAETSDTLLRVAHERGHMAMDEDASVLNMVTMHHKVLDAILARNPPSARAALIDRAAQFFINSLLPYEMLLRQCRESNVALIAERKAIEQQLRQSHKMEAMGQLTSGITHDFNNLLSIIICRAETLLEFTRCDSEQAALANAIIKTVMRGTEMTRRLLTFVRQTPFKLQLINLNECLADIKTMLQCTLGTSIHISTILADGLWLTNTDSSQIEDALTNLAINARDAMPAGGNFRIETANAHLDQKYVAEHKGVKSGDYVLLSVTDNGVGMSPEIIKRATEPFFTTKQIGKGTGLGLSMISDFVQKSGGYMQIESEAGIGTTVNLYLPRGQNEDTGIGTEINTQGLAPTGGEWILLVDTSPVQ